MRLNKSRGCGNNKIILSKLSKTQVNIYFVVKRGKEEENGRQAWRLIHLMPRSCLAWLPFVAESAGQRRKADTKNRQDALQDTLCAIAIHRRQDKAVSCLDTSLTHSLQLSHGTGLTTALLLGLAHCYSGASATTHTHTHTHNMGPSSIKD